VAFGLLALFGPSITGLSPFEIDLRNRLAGGSTAHWFGTDANGRDVFTRWAYAGRVSLGVGLVAVLVSVPLGTLLGLVAGFFGRVVDAAIMRVTDAMLSVPLFMLLLIMLAMLRPSATAVILVIGMTTWMGVARLVRGEVLRLTPQEFVVAARAIGVGDTRIMWRHVLPAVAPVIIVAATIGIPQAILLESTLSYFGLGVQPPTPSWGNMLGDAQQYMWNAPWLAMWPGVAIFLSVLSLNALGERLRRRLEPRGGRRARTS
jgi:peptide/nickel transport system permease protein